MTRLLKWVRLMNGESTNFQTSDTKQKLVPARIVEANDSGAKFAKNAHYV